MSGFEKPSGVYPYADHGATVSSPALTLVPMSDAPKAQGPCGPPSTEAEPKSSP